MHLQSKDCCVCLEDLRSRHFIQLHCCKNKFHPECLFKWFSRQQSCPLCRSTVMNISGTIDASMRQQQSEMDRKLLADFFVYACFAWLIYNSNPVNGPLYAFCFLYTFIVRRAP